MHELLLRFCCWAWLAALVPLAGIASEPGHFLARPTDSEALAKVIPTTWSPTSGLCWKADLEGNGQSSPVVSDGIVYVTTIDGSMKEWCCVTAIELATGKQLWAKRVASAAPIRANYFQCRSSSTPVADRDGVIAFFETGNLIAFNRDGEIRWQMNMITDYGPFESTIGLTASLAQLNDLAFVLVDHEGESYLLAVSTKTGEEQWKAERFSRKSYSSPAILELCGRKQIVCSSNGSVDGYDPASGELLWTFEDIGANSQNTPQQIGENKFLVGASPGMHDAFEAQARTSNLCMQVTEDDGKFEAKVLWRTDPKVMSHFASPIEHQGLAYWVTKAGAVYCYDVSDGSLVYRERIDAGQCWATPIAIGNRVYFFGKDGTTTVLNAGPEFDVVAENNLWDPGESAQNAPTFAGRPNTVSEGDEPTQTRGRPEGSASGGRPPMSDEQMQAAREQGENRFADPVQYAAVVTDHGLLLRTGHALYLIAKGERQ